MSSKSAAAGFVIEIVPGKAEVAERNNSERTVGLHSSRASGSRRIEPCLTPPDRVDDVADGVGHQLWLIDHDEVAAVGCDSVCCSRHQRRQLVLRVLPDLLKFRDRPLRLPPDRECSSTIIGRCGSGCAANPCRMSTSVGGRSYSTPGRS